MSLRIKLVQEHVRLLGCAQYVRPAPLQYLEVRQVWGESVRGDRYVQQIAHVLFDYVPSPRRHGQYERDLVAAHHPDVAALSVVGKVRLV